MGLGRVPRRLELSSHAIFSHLMPMLLICLMGLGLPTLSSIVMQRPHRCCWPMKWSRCLSKHAASGIVGCGRLTESTPLTVYGCGVSIAACNMILLHWAHIHQFHLPCLVSAIVCISAFSKQGEDADVFVLSIHLNLGSLLNAHCQGGFVGMLCSGPCRVQISARHQRPCTVKGQ